MIDPRGPALFLFAVGLVLLFFTAFAAAQRRVRAAPEFALLMLSSTIYAFCYAVELSQDTVDGMLAAIRFSYFGISTAPVFWLLFSLAFCRVKRPAPGLVALLLAIPLLVLASLWTNDSHHLYYARTWARTDGPFPSFGFERGPIYWFNLVYEQACIVVGNVVLIVYALRSPRFIRRQAIVAGIGALGPWAGNVGYLMGWVPWGLDPLPFCLALTGCFSAFALFGLGFLELVPAARDRAIESLRDGFIVVDRRGRVVDANDAAGLLLGDWVRRAGEPIARNEIGSPEIARVLEGEAEIAFSLRGRDGAERRLVAQSFRVAEGSRAVGGRAIMVRDVTETAALLDRLSELAATDELTGLPNRRGFLESGRAALALAIRESRSVAVAILDIDHFKEVNDRFGHAVGDLALKHFAARLSASIRESDMLCRYGGEEFAILITRAEPPASALAAVERIRVAATEESFPIEGSTLAIRASAGLYSAIPADGARLDEYLDAADSALYEAKAAGRDRSVLRAPGN